MSQRWSVSAHLQAVQFDYEKASKLRPVRLSAPSARVGDPVRIGVSGAEVECRIVEAGSVLRVKVQATPLKARPPRKVRRA